MDISVKENTKKHKSKFNEKITNDINYLKEKHENAKRFIEKFPTMKSHKFKDSIHILQNKKNRHLQE